MHDNPPGQHHTVLPVREEITGGETIGAPCFNQADDLGVSNMSMPAVSCSGDREILVRSVAGIENGTLLVPPEKFNQLFS